ncbi:P2X purinoceptor 7-like [Acropora millepora]|uniref:P2X purinoceptor 7-like n=1 Tax=Acropora millepora TaxID=45264 RepID=UPI001CF59C5D|nr:P2X purinoceptor 7-like [Acropora millepora]XP_044181319.1 P2X purinoceptor 7-like [Acropora millepora]
MAESGSSSKNFSGDNDSERFTIQPYQFEPRIDSDEADSIPEGGISGDESDIETTNPRLQNSDWCACENCQIMERAESCVCCQEIEQVKNKLIEAVSSGECEEQPKCITQHPGFHPVCTNRWVLQTAWYQYKQQYKDSYDGTEDKLFRHIAYRQLARWCWGILGKEIRVVLPSCAVMCIRNFYPPPGPEEEFIFKGFRYADE